MSRSGSLIKNTIIFAIGNVGSKLIQFLLLPFYTNVLSNAEYGIIDNLQNIGIILIPLVSLSIAEGVFRYAMDSATKKEDAFSTGINISAVGSLIVIACGIVMYALGFFRAYVWLVIGYTISNIFCSVVMQYVRAIGKVRFYTVASVLQTLFIMLFNILFLVVFNMNIQGYMMGYTLSYTLVFFIVLVGGKLWRCYHFRADNKNTLKAMIKYSVPLIPNTICWWLTTTMGKFMVTAYLGEEANGIFAVAFKIPAIVTVVVGIFLQAWQMSANTEIEKKDFNEYNSKAFNFLQTISFITSAVLVLSCRIIILLMGESFQEAWVYIPVMLIGISFFTLAQFLGSLYTASKKTFMAFVSNLISAVVNIVLNILLLPRMGVMGAAVSIMISYLVFWLVRLIDTKSIAPLKYPVGVLVFNVVALSALSVIVTKEIPYWWLIGGVLFLGMLVVNRKNILALIKIFLNQALGILRRKS